MKSKSIAVEHDDLVAVAEELNELMFDEGEGIDVEASDKKITAGILEAAGELTPKDEISKATRKTLIALGAIEDEAPEEEEVPEDAKKEEEEEEPPAKKKADKKPTVKADKGKSMKEEKPAAPAKDIKKTEEKEDKPKAKRVFAKRTGIIAKAMVFFVPLVEKGKFTKVELVEKAKAKYPEANEATLRTLLQDGKNPKYNKFPKLMYQNPETKIYSFNKK